MKNKTASIESFLEYYNGQIDILLSECCIAKKGQEIKLSANEDVLRFVFNWSLTEIREYAHTYVMNKTKL